jgi:cysteinyl-tRNA synthetase
MLRAHYRQPIDWTVRALEEAEKMLDRWYDAVGDIEPSGEAAEGVVEALSDDLNIPAAIAELHRLAHPALAGRAIAGLMPMGQAPAPDVLKSSANLLGLLSETRSERESRRTKLEPAAAERIEKFIAERTTARAAKNWAESDRLRDELAKMGVAIKDSKDGTTWELRR